LKRRSATSNGSFSLTRTLDINLSLQLNFSVEIAEKFAILSGQLQIINDYVMKHIVLM